jgi:hypothetical protein
MLEPQEREAVLGDFAESGETGGRALSGLAGLIARRQAALWKDWRPWLALAGIVVPISLLLRDFSVFVSGTYHLYSWIIENYHVIDPALLEETGFPLGRGISKLICYSLLLVSWSWSAGFVLGSLSRRTTWLNGALLCVIWYFVGDLVRPSGVSAILFLVPLFWGAYQGVRLGGLTIRQATLLAIMTATLTVSAFWIGGWVGGGTWQTRQLLLSFVLSWPVCYLAGAAMVNRQAKIIPA